MFRRYYGQRRATGSPVLRLCVCEIPFSTSSAPRSRPLVLLAGFYARSILFLQEHYLHYSSRLFRHLQCIFNTGSSYNIQVSCKFRHYTIKHSTFAADLRYVLFDVLQHFFHIVAYFDFRSSRAKLYLTSAARKSPSLQRYYKQCPDELVSVFQVDSIRCVKSLE